MYLEVINLLNRQLHLLLERLLLNSKVRDVTSLTSKDMLSARQLGLPSRICVLFALIAINLLVLVIS